MSTERLDRINELARKKKAEGLTSEETAEHERLRSEYIAAFRRNMIAQLDNTYIIEPDGTKRRLSRTQE